MDWSIDGLLDGGGALLSLVGLGLGLGLVNRGRVSPFNTDLPWEGAGQCLVPGAASWMPLWLEAKPASRRLTDTATWREALGRVPRSRCLGRYVSVDVVQEPPAHD